MRGHVHGCVWKSGGMMGGMVNAGGENVEGLGLGYQ